MTDPNPDIPNDPQNPNIDQQSQQQEQEETAHSNPQSPQTLTLSNQDPQIQILPDSDPHQPPQEKEEDAIMEDPIQKPEGPEPEAAAVVSAISSSRRAPKRKKMRPKRTAQEKKSREKLQVLVETLKPIPFVPAKALDFARHQSFLQRLGLWEFVNLEFDPVVRGDLLAQLIASYVPASRCSYVNEVRINVNRADLGRALKLPKKNSAPAAAEESGEPVDLAESIGFIEDLVSNWMLLHDDMFILPNEVIVHLNLIRGGDLGKVDWAGLIWSMLEKELKTPQLVNCYYASHLQQLIKAQHEELLKEAPQEEEEEGEEICGKDEGEDIDVKDEGEDINVKDGEDEEEEDEEEMMPGEEVDASGDMKMGGVDEGSRDCDLEEHNIELSLGQDNVERVEIGKEHVEGDQIIDFEQAKEEESGLWLMDQKNNVGGPFLRQCHTSDVKGVEAVDCGEAKEDEAEEGQEQDEEEEEAEEDGHEGGFNLSPKCLPLEGMPSGTGGLIQDMEGSQMPFGSGIDLRDNPVGDFLSSRDDPQMISGSSLFGNGHKREINLDNPNTHHTLNGSNKRLRSDSPWNSKPVDFEMCMEQIEHWMGKARMMYAAKEQACEESTINQQLLLNELQKRDEMVEHLHKTKVDDINKRQMEIYRFEKELYMMTSLVDGYRKALKETQKAFAEYRARCPQAEEPLYKDVPGSGGLVLSVMELEKERLRKEEEERTKFREFLRELADKELREIESTWFGKLEGHLSMVESLGSRLLAIEGQVKHWNEVKAKSKVSDLPECAPTTEGQDA